MVNINIAPSLLAYDHCRLLEGVHIVENLGLKRLHIDIMDGNFVPNLSFGPQLVADLYKQTSLLLDVHLMLAHPESFVERFIDAGANSVMIHQEASCDISQVLSDINNNHCLSGIAINPESQPNVALLNSVNFVLVMGVHPGFGNQKFIPEMLTKVQRFADFRKDNNLSYKIVIDGGVTNENALQLMNNGADILVSGSAFFKAPKIFLETFC